MSCLQNEGYHGLMKNGRRIPYSACLMAPIKVPRKDACSLGLPEMLTPNRGHALASSKRLAKQAFRDQHNRGPTKMSQGIHFFCDYN